MLVLGHTGITLGAATLLAVTLKRSHSSQSGKVSWFTHLGRYVDIRLLLVGSLLPDIIDKPVGHYFLGETFSNGRIFSHTLVFLILITVIGYYLYKYHRKIWLLSLALGTFMHLILDEMWLSPRTLFWPLLGFGFERVDLTNWMSNIFNVLFSNPAVYVPEAVGFLILLWFLLTLLAGKKFRGFLRYGRAS